MRGSRGEKRWERKKVKEPNRRSKIKLDYTVSLLVHLGRREAGAKEGNQSEASEAGPQGENKVVGKSKERGRSKEPANQEEWESGVKNSENQEAKRLGKPRGK